MQIQFKFFLDIRASDVTDAIGEFRDWFLYDVLHLQKPLLKMSAQEMNIHFFKEEKLERDTIRRVGNLSTEELKAQCVSFMKTPEYRQLWEAAKNNYPSSWTWDEAAENELTHMVLWGQVRRQELSKLAAKRKR